ncbi:MAG: GNAT family N-acetyltransferase [Candidatus Omnitrophota bacterium]
MKKYYIEKADLLRDVDDILLILNNNFNSEVLREKFEWKYKKCPFGEAAAWIAKEINTNRVSGVGALFKREFEVSGKIFTFGVAGDFGVNKEDRVFGPALKLQKTIITNSAKEGMNFLYGIPNKSSKKLLEKAGYQNIGNFCRFVKILKTEHKLREKIKGDLLPKALAKFLDVFLCLCFRESFAKNFLGYSMKFHESFDNKFDSFFEKTKHQFKIMGVRGTAYLNWRYFSYQANEYKIFSIEKNNEIQGYLVYYLENGTMHIVDVLALNEKTWEALMWKFVIYARGVNAKAVAIRFMGTNKIVKQLKRIGYWLREADDPFLVFAHEGLVKKEIFDCENWYFFEGDNDV